MKKIIYYLLFAVFILNTGMSCEDVEDDDSNEIELAKVEAVNLDNTGKNFVTGGEEIKKEAYMIGINLYSAEKNEDGTIKGYLDVSNYYDLSASANVLRIYCLTDFDGATPAGSDVTSFFQSYPLSQRNYNEIMALRRIPEPGIHSFKVVITRHDETVIESVTEPVTLF